MVIATRHYQRGEGQSLNNVQLGLLPGAMAAPPHADDDGQTEEAVMNTTTIDGFRVHQSHEKAQKSDAIIVILGGDDKGSAIYSMD